eukprot:gnl/Chilomastix_caulleri/4616.p2 GENE.gnl/Chilomastix_caulleri/4616~~gnl/Chilomastix_caulleri/4616.p2  ORF type:complete len:83 (+),score=11.35 gnl/Chilomastix_caulleri/4616:138-386(+)
MAMLSQFGTVLNIEDIILKGNSSHCVACFSTFGDADKAIAFPLFLGGRKISIRYAWKPGTKEPHGSAVERMINALASESRKE